MNNNTPLNKIIPIHAEGDAINLTLQEIDTKENDSVCVNGRHFKILSTSNHPENLYKIRERINLLCSEPNLSPRELMCRILDCNEDAFSEESIIKIDDIKTAFIQDHQTSSWERAVSKSYKNVHTNLLETLNIAASEEKRLVSERLTHSYQLNPSYDKESLTSRAFYSLQSLVAQLKMNRLDDQLKEHRIEMLQTMYKLHQLSPTATTEDKENSLYRLQSMLERAILVEHIAHVNNLIQAGTEITNYHLYLAIGVNSDKLVDKFINGGLDPNAKMKKTQFSTDYSFLEIACMRGQKASKAIDALIKHGADLTLLDSRGRAPINLAITSDLSSNEVIKLIEKMENLNFLDGKSESLLHSAINRIKYRNDPTIFNYLLDQGATPNIKNSEGRTSLHSVIELLEEKALPHVKKLILQGGIATTLDKNDQTPLHYAARQSCLQSSQGIKDSGDLVRFLINNGAKVNMTDNEGRTALHEAVRFGMDAENINSVEELIKAGANLDLKDHEGNTPLHLAAEHVELVRILLEHGANRNIRNNVGRLPGAMECISEKSKEQILKLLANI